MLLKPLGRVGYWLSFTHQTLLFIWLSIFLDSTQVGMNSQNIGVISSNVLGASSSIFNLRTEIQFLHLKNQIHSLQGFFFFLQNILAPAMLKIESVLFKRSNSKLGICAMAIKSAVKCGSARFQSKDGRFYSTL